MTDTFTTRHGTFGAGEAIWHVGPCGERTRAATIRDVGPAFAVVFHDAPGVHLVPANEVRKPGSWRRAEVLRAAIGRRRQDHIVVIDEPFIGLLPNPFPKVHRNRERAEAEAHRLAGKNPGKTFQVFAAVSEAAAVNITVQTGLRRLAD